ncbi:MAG TPA: hypothetical protein VJQ79_01640 [Acidimicrobiia bacterium]|nr:hypothetical protein [Acidimicrobiia bacterium]
MEGQFYITTIAGLGVSLAGFSALLTLFRAGQVWDAVTLWRARAIVRTSLETALAMLTVIPIYYLTGSDAWAIRAGTLIMLAYGLIDSRKMGPRRQPEAWPDPRRVLPYYIVTVVFSAVLAVNLGVANLGIFLASGLWSLGLPMTIFMSVLDEFRPGQHIGPSDSAPSAPQAEPGLPG